MFSLTVCTTLHEDDEMTHRLPKTDEEEISTYVEAVIFFLKFYATVIKIAESNSVIACWKKILMEPQYSLLMSSAQK